MQIITTQQVMDDYLSDYSVTRDEASDYKRMLVRLLISNICTSPLYGLGLLISFSSDSISQEIGRSAEWFLNTSDREFDRVEKVKRDLIRIANQARAMLKDVSDKNPKLVRYDPDLTARVALILSAAYDPNRGGFTSFVKELPNPREAFRIWRILSEDHNVFGNEPSNAPIATITTENKDMNQKEPHIHNGPAPLFERIAMIRGQRAESFNNDQLIGFIQEAEGRIKSLREVKTKSTAIDREIESLESAVKEIAAVLDARPVA